MIKYSETNIGDILRVVDLDASSYKFETGELCRVLEVHNNSCTVENRDGKQVEYVFNCGAARVEPTEWKRDFPS